MYRDTIISYRKQFDKPVEHILDTLNSVEINPVELCTRKCIFSPRAHGYKNQSLHMAISTAHSIGSKLAAVEYKGGIGISGFGEPLLHTSIVDVTNTSNVKVRFLQYAASVNGNWSGDTNNSYTSFVFVRLGDT